MTGACSKCAPPDVRRVMELGAAAVGARLFILRQRVINQDVDKDAKQ